VRRSPCKFKFFEAKAAPDCGRPWQRIVPLRTSASGLVTLMVSEERPAPGNSVQASDVWHGRAWPRFGCTKRPSDRTPGLRPLRLRNASWHALSAAADAYVFSELARLRAGTFATPGSMRAGGGSINCREISAMSS